MRYAKQPRLVITEPANNGGRAVVDARYIVGNDGRFHVRPCAGVIAVECHHWTNPPLRRWNGFSAGLGGSGSGGQNAGPGGTIGGCKRVIFSNKAQVNGLVPAPVGMPRYSRLKAASPRACRSCSRNSGLKFGFTSAVARSRIHEGSSLDHAVQNGSARLHAVDSMARRVCGLRARIGRKAEMRSLDRRAASSATIQASTVSPRTESSLPGSASTRTPLAISNPYTLSLVSLAPAFNSISRTRRTASPLWRWAAGHHRQR